MRCLKLRAEVKNDLGVRTWSNMSQHDDDAGMRKIRWEKLSMRAEIGQVCHRNVWAFEGHNGG